MTISGPPVHRPGLARIVLAAYALALYAIAAYASVVLGASSARAETGAAPAGAAAAAATFPLEVHAVGFDDESGHAVGMLFRDGANVSKPEQAVERVVAEIRGGEALLTFGAIAEGPYAIVLFHDANDNGHVDHGLFGPIEQLGFSNGYRFSLFRGAPTFAKLQVEIKAPTEPGAARLEIAVK